jgi:hypothetical protein
VTLVLAQILDPLYIFGGTDKRNIYYFFPHMWDPHLIIFGGRDERNKSRIQNAQYDAAKKREVKQNEQ